MYFLRRMPTVRDSSREDTDVKRLLNSQSHGPVTVLCVKTWWLWPHLEVNSCPSARYCPTCKNDTSEVVKAGEKLKASKKKAKMPSATTESQRDWGKVSVWSLTTRGRDSREPEGGAVSSSLCPEGTETPVLEKKVGMWNMSCLIWEKKKIPKYKWEKNNKIFIKKKKTPEFSKYLSVHFSIKPKCLFLHHNTAFSTNVDFCNSNLLLLGRKQPNISGWFCLLISWPMPSVWHPFLFLVFLSVDDRIIAKNDFNPVSGAADRTADMCLNTVWFCICFEVLWFFFCFVFLRQIWCVSYYHSVVLVWLRSMV